MSPKPRPYNKTTLFLCGKIGVGKTTVANKLKQIFSEGEKVPKKDISIYGFGKAIRDEVAEIYGVPKEHLYNDKVKYDTIPWDDISEEGCRLMTQVFWKEHPGLYFGAMYSLGLISKEDIPVNFEWMDGPTTRLLLQFHGSEVRRREHPSWWDHRGRDYVLANSTESNMVIMDDGRFKTELSTFREIVENDPSHRVIVVRIMPYPGYEYPTNPHSSELDMDEYDALIDNPEGHFCVGCDTGPYDVVFYPEYGDESLQEIADRLSIGLI